MADFPSSVFAVAADPAGPGNPPYSDRLEFGTEPEAAATYDTERVCQYVSLEALEGAEAIEVVATILAGDPELASLRADEATRALRALGDHFRGERP